MKLSITALAVALLAREASAHCTSPTSIKNTE
jgi:hypothetical protein